MARPRKGRVGLARLPTLILGFGGFALLGGNLSEEFVGFPNLSGRIKSFHQIKSFFGEALGFGEVALSLQQVGEVVETFGNANSISNFLASLDRLPIPSLCRL